MSGEKPAVKSDSDLRDEVERIKSNVDKTVGELRGEIEDLKSALIELKSSLSEMENPFNLLSSLMDGENIKRIMAHADSEREKSVKVEVGEGEEKEKNVELPQSPSETPPEADYNASVALIRWVWSLLDLGFDVEDIERISKYCEFFSLLRKGSSHYISTIAPTIEKARALNLCEDIVTLSIYGAAKLSGVKVDLEDITGVVFNALRKLVSKSPEGVGLKG